MVATVGGEVADVVKRLSFGFMEVFAEGFVLDEHDAGPEEVNAGVIAGDFLDGFLERGDDAAFDAEDVEEFVPESLFFGGFAADAGPFAGEFDGVVADLVPTEWHGGRIRRKEIGERRKE